MRMIMDRYLILSLNLEQIIKIHLKLNNVEIFVKHFLFIMYSVKNIDGTKIWEKEFFQ